MKLFIETFGCQMNEADSREMGRHLSERGFAPVSIKERADILLLNTCTVRQHAEDKALSYIGRLKDWKKKDPARLLIVTGCAAESLQKSLKKRFPHIDLVVGAKRIEEFPKLVDELLKQKNRIPASAGMTTNYDWFEESEESFGRGKTRSEGEPFNLGESDSAFVTIMR